MEKQPVDDLFARKLRDAEAPVGPDTFNQLQQRLGVKQLPVRKPVVPWRQIAVAACVLLVAVFLYTLNRTGLQSKEKSGQTTPIAKVDGSRPALEPADRDEQNRSQNEGIDKKSDPIQQPVSSGKATYLAEQLRSSYLRKGEQPIKPVNSNKVILAEKPEEKRQEQMAEVVTAVHKEEKPSTAVTQQFASIPTSTDRIDRINTKLKQPVERTIILTIEDAQPEVSLAAADAIRKTELQGHQNGLSGLFGKLKQLKNGEVLAKATPPGESLTNQKNRLGRVFNEVKESLKNETTLE